MDKLQQEIVTFLYEEEQRTGNVYMDKTLSEGCLFTLNVLDLGPDIFKITDGGDDLEFGYTRCWFYKNNRYEDFCDEILQNLGDGTGKITILGHYDIISVLKYIDSKIIGDVLYSKGRIYEVRDLNESDGGGSELTFIGKIPDKYIALYTEQENLQLFDFLNKLK